ncbi:MAG: MBG domain-containing protein [Clostridia bacterium]|nr:MBG domain-containing protein [Clostridia bacterium]
MNQKKIQNNTSKNVLVLLLVLFISVLFIFILFSNICYETSSDLALAADEKYHINIDSLASDHNGKNESYVKVHTGVYRDTYLVTGLYTKVNSDYYLVSERGKTAEEDVDYYERRYFTGISMPETEGSSFMFYHGTGLCISGTSTVSGTYPMIRLKSDGSPNASDPQNAIVNATNGDTVATYGNFALYKYADGASEFGSFSSQPIGGDSDVFYKDDNPFSRTAMVMTFKLGEDFLKLLNDHLVTIKCQPYAICGGDDTQPETEYDKAKVALHIYSVDQTGRVTISNVFGTDRECTFKNDFDDRNINILTEREYRINSNSGNNRYANGTFLQMTIYGFKKAGNNYTLAIKELGLKFTVTYNDSLSFDLNGEDVTVTADNPLYRNPLCPYNYVTKNDNISARITISAGGPGITLASFDAASMEYYTPQLTNFSAFVNSINVSQSEGIVFRYFFLSAADTSTIKWEVKVGQASEPISSSGGQVASFNIVNGGSEPGSDRFIVRIEPYMEYRSPATPERNISRMEVNLSGFEFNVDSTAPNVPNLTENNFYNAYFTGGDSEDSYFTAIDADSEYDNQTGKVVRLIINGGSGSSNNPRFDDPKKVANSVLDDEGSDLIIYYKTSYVGTTIPQSLEDISSIGFDVYNIDGDIDNTNETIGEYVGVMYNEGASLYEYKMFISMRDRLGNQIENGVWAIELLAYDYVGNSTYRSTKYFLKVDISDYIFNFAIVSPEEVSFEPEDQFTVQATSFSGTGAKTATYAEYDELGTNYQISLKRGSYVSLTVKYSSTNISKNYILTQFKTTGYNVDCSQLPIEASAVKITTENTYKEIDGKNEYYSFQVNKKFVKNADNRRLILTFKEKATITAITTATYVYDKTEKSVSLKITHGNNTITGLRVNTTYYTDSEYTHPISTNFPINAGTYYYIAEIKDSINYYGILKSSFIINKATPNINSIEDYVNPTQTNLAYGSSLSMIDYPEEKIYANINGVYYQQPNENINAGFSFKDEDGYTISVILPSISTNGIPGYYYISPNSTLTDATYNKPKAGVLDVLIRFVPVLGEFNQATRMVNYTYGDDEHYSEYVRIVNGIEYKDFIPDTNYNTVDKIVKITIKHSTDCDITFTLDSGYARYDAEEEYNIEDTSEHFALGEYYKYVRYEYEFNNVEKTISYVIKSTNEKGQNDQYLDISVYGGISYCNINPDLMPTLSVSSLVFTTDVPRNAGIYLIKVEIDKTKCNYTKSFYVFVVINKRVLDVRIENTEVDYQYEMLPNIVSTLNNQTIAVDGYDTKFYYYDGVAIDSTNTIESYLVEENLVAASDMRTETKIPLTAGKYIVYAKVVAGNYTGNSAQFFTIKKVTEASQALRVRWPKVTNSIFSTDYELSYGQALGNVRLNTSAQTFKYTYRTYSSPQRYQTNQRDIAGYVIVVTQKYKDFILEEGFEGYSREDYVNYMKQVVQLDVKIVDGNLAQYDNLWFCFVPEDSNFDFIYEVSDPIVVGGAILEYSHIYIDDIIYEDVVSMKTIQDPLDETKTIEVMSINTTKSLGMLYSTENANNVSGIVPVGAIEYNKNVTIENYEDNFYYYIYDNRTYRIINPDLYTYSVTGRNKIVAGISGVTIKVDFEENEVYRYGLLNSSTVQINVEKKGLTLEYVLGEEDISESNYNNIDFTELRKRISINTENNDITFNSNTNTYVYTDPQNRAVIINGIFTFVDKLDAEKVYNQNDVIPVGTYTVTYTITDDNYSGSTSFDYEIKKAVLKISTKPSIENPSTVVYYNNLVSNVNFIQGVMVEKRTDEEERRVNGRFVVIAEAEQKFGNAGTYTNVFFTYIPADEDNYEVFVGTSLNGGYVRTVISRYDVSEFMEISLKHDVNEYGTVTYESDETTRTNKYLEDIISYVTSLAEIENLTVKVTVASKNNQLLLPTLNVGSYTIMLSLVENNENINYKGSVKTDITISKAGAYIVPVYEYNTINCKYTIDEVDGIKRTFNNKALNVSAQVFDARNDVRLVGQAINVSYYQNSGYVRNPINIGYYDVSINLKDSINYRLINKETGDDIDSYSTFLVIAVDKSKITLSNLNQTYLSTKDIGVNLGINVANYIVYYGEIGVTTFPKNAGQYEIYLDFTAAENYGYSEIIHMRDVKTSYYLTIDKYSANIIVQTSVFLTYSGVAGIPFTIYTDPSGRVLKYSYKLTTQGINEYQPITLQNINALDAGRYDIKIEIDENNYKGSANMILEISGASISISAIPTLGTYVYNSTEKPVITGGRAVTTKTNVDVEGSFDIDLGEVNTLNVGIYSVPIVFIPSSNNYSQATTTASLTIVKKELNEDFFMLLGVDGEYIQEMLISSNRYIEYNGQAHNMYVTYDQSMIYETNNDINIVVKYNGTMNLPIQIGSYDISLSLDSRNYYGSRTYDYQLVINKANPYIAEKPTVLDTYTLNQTITQDTQLIGGRAIIYSTGEEISGTFKMVDASYTFNKANINNVKVRFTPLNLTLYEEKVFDMPINVIGKDVFTIGGETKVEGTTNNNNDWTDTTIEIKGISKLITTNFVKANNAYGDHSSHGVRILIKPKNNSASLEYGVTLNDFDVSFVAEDPDCEECQEILNELNECGILSFNKPTTYIPKVGEKVEVIYTLFTGKIVDENKYNTMIGLISLDGILVKKEISSMESTGVIIYNLGNEINSDNFIATIFIDGQLAFAFDFRDALNKKLYGYLGIVEGIESVISYGYTPDEYDEYTFNFETQNYIFDNSNSYYIHPRSYLELQNNEMVAKNSSKIYDTKAISAADLDLRISNTTYDANVLDNAWVSIYSSDMSGISEGIECGDYKVLVIYEDLNNDKFCMSLIDFSIEKRDVSSEISISRVIDMYGNTTVGKFDVLWNDIVVIPDNIEYKLSTEDDALYSRNIVFNAGSYSVRISIEEENYYGVAIIEYYVNPQVLIMRTNENQYVYTYGDINIKSPTVSFETEDGAVFVAAESYLYFYSSTYAKSLILPQYAGEYVCSVEIPDSNYVISNPAFNFTINPASIVMNKSPKFGVVAGDSYNLVYGQKLSEATILTDAENKYLFTNNDNEIDGTFAPEEPNRIVNAGTTNVKYIFTPYDRNYESYTVTLSIKVAKAEASVLFTNLTSIYNGASRLSDLRYTVTPNINVEFTFKNTALVETKAPINAGIYTISASTNNPNYTVVITKTSEQKDPLFTIYKARVSSIEKPNASSITVGKSLSNSVITNGKVYYEGFNNSIEGSYSYIQNLYVFSEAGEYQGIEYVFTPNSNNFESYVSTVTVKVEKAVAQIAKKTVVTTYGTPFDVTGITFNTNPGNLNVIINTTYDNVTYKTGDIIDAGTYFFKCSVSDKNYYSLDYELEFIVERKVIDIDFIDSNGSVVTTYKTPYGGDVYYKYRLYSANSSEDKSKYLLKDAATIEQNITYLFTSKDGTGYESTAMPSDIGTYDLTVNLYHPNYVASNVATFRIEVGTVESIEFDYNSLQNQIYGDVSAPIVRTTPANVSYYIIYQGYDLVLPKDVGTYNITVYIDDSNYSRTQVNAIFKINPKQISVTDINVKDKVYDGTSTLEITGRLEGALFGDEIYLTMRATTYLQEKNVGKHYVTITQATITGMDSANYDLVYPEYNKTVSIYNNIVKDAKSSSYVTCDEGLELGTSISFENVSVKENKSSFWSKLVGADADVIQYSIKVNNVEVIGNRQYKVSILIPTKYADQDFTVNFTGSLAGEVVSYTREGDYLSFYTQSATGEIVFSVSKFKYEYVVAASILVIILIAAIVLIILNPIRNRRSIQDPAAEKRARKYIKSRKY